MEIILKQLKKCQMWKGKKKKPRFEWGYIIYGRMSALAVLIGKSDGGI